MIITQQLIIKSYSLISHLQLSIRTAQYHDANSKFLHESLVMIQHFLRQLMVHLRGITSKPCFVIMHQTNCRELLELARAVRIDASGVCVQQLNDEGIKRKENENKETYRK